MPLFRFLPFLSAADDTLVSGIFDFANDQDWLLFDHHGRTGRKRILVFYRADGQTFRRTNSHHHLLKSFILRCLPSMLLGSEKPLVFGVNVAGPPFGDTYNLYSPSVTPVAFSLARATDYVSQFDTIYFATPDVLWGRPDQFIKLFDTHSPGFKFSPDALIWIAYEDVAGQQVTLIFGSQFRDICQAAQDFYARIQGIIQLVATRRHYDPETNDLGIRGYQALFEAELGFEILVNQLKAVGPTEAMLVNHWTSGIRAALKFP